MHQLTCTEFEALFDQEWEVNKTLREARTPLPRRMSMFAEECFIDPSCASEAFKELLRHQLRNLKVDGVTDFEGKHE